MQAHTLMSFARVVVRGRVAGDHQHGGAVHGRRSDAGDHVGQARRQMDVQHRQLLRQPGVGVGGVGRLLFMPEGDILDTVPLARVDQRIVGVAALPEDLLDAFFLQA